MSLNLSAASPPRNVMATIQTTAMRATRRAYSTRAAPVSSELNLACSHALRMVRFMCSHLPYGALVCALLFRCPALLRLLKLSAHAASDWIGRSAHPRTRGFGQGHGVG